uniref:LysR family transcriptional regulator n=1 Tax=Microbulbifer agarilyticus TaxID=260552 RepID=UPI0004923B10|nr:LysR family transcriptional regulator [Microbulbifer agarilyticus]
MSYFAQLRTFVEVYRCGNITKAAGNLGLSQPAATAHIQTMESVIGRPLFERQARGVKPTAAAHDLAAQVAGHLDAIELKIASVRRRSTDVQGTINIAGPAEYISYVGATQLANLLQSGATTVVLHIGGAERLYGLLDSGDADLAITASTPDSQRFESQVLDSERLLLVANTFVARQVTPDNLDALAELPVVSYDAQLPLIRDYFKAVFNAPCGSLVAALCPDIRVLLGLVQAGVGYSVFPDYLCSREIEKGRLATLGAVGPENNIYLVWRKGALSHPRIQYARDILMAYANLNRYAHQTEGGS